MKRFISTIISIVILICFSLPVGAYDYYYDVNRSFLISSDGSLYLTKETKAGEIKYFGERFEICSPDGTYLTADDYIKTGDKLIYFGIQENTITVVGDVDCNGRITTSDARYVLRLAANLIPYRDKIESYGAVDANKSGILEASDARAILRVAAKIDDFSEFEAVVSENIESAADGDFDDELIMVCLNPEYANNEAVYTPEFYGDKVAKVEILAKYADNHVWLCLYLKDRSKENVYSLADECQNNDAIICTCKNYYMYLD